MPSEIDQRRLRDGERALAAERPKDRAGLKDYLSLLSDGIAALQSLDDLGSPAANTNAWKDMGELQRRYEQTVSALLDEPPAHLSGPAAAFADRFGLRHLSAALTSKPEATDEQQARAFLKETCQFVQIDVDRLASILAARARTERFKTVDAIVTWIRAHDPLHPELAKLAVAIRQHFG